MLRVDVVTIFPRMLEAPLAEGIVRRACDKGLCSLHVHDLREQTSDRHRSVDDKAFGGGPGMVMKVEPFARQLELLFPEGRPSDSAVVLLSPRGRRFDQRLAEELAGLERLVLLCGRYEGVDERVREALCTHEVSLGDFVLTGGETAALAVVEACVRLLPGALGDDESAACDSFADGLLDHPHYTRPAEFLYENLAIQTNVIHSAWRNGVRKLCFLGSSCIYPKLAPQPLKEEYLLTGPLEPTNEWYAIAKIAGIKQCQAYRRQYGFDAISLMPTNLYGPGDNFDLQNSHVLPALIRKFHEAKAANASEVVIWGTGTPLREFLHVDDMADAAVFLMRNYSEEQFVNVGSGEDLSIRDLAGLVADVVGYSGRIVNDASKPDGTPRKLMDVSRLRAMGWAPRIGLREGIESAYRWYVANG